MLSSVVFHHTLRESSALIEGLQYSPEGHVFASVDASAVRLWSTSKQIKSFHFSSQVEIICFEYLPYFDCFLLVCYHQEDQVGRVDLWDVDLNKIHSTILKSICIRSKCVLSPDKSFFILTDNEDNVIVYDIIASKKIKTAEGPLYSTSSVSKQSTSELRPLKYIPRIELCQCQKIMKSTLGYPTIHVLRILNCNCFVLIASNVMYLFKRAKGKEPFIVDIEKAPRNEQDRTDNVNDFGENNDVDTSIAPIITAEHFREDYNFNLTLKFDALFQVQTTPTSVQIMGNISNLLCVTFTNGYIGIYDCGDMFSPKCHKSNPTDSFEADSYDVDDLDGDPPSPVAYFKAHSPLAHSPFISVQVENCPWQTVPGGVYVLEFFSMGSDFKLCHWGLRRRIDNPAMSPEGRKAPPSAASQLRPNRNFKKFSYDIDLLGSFRFPQDSQERKKLSSLAKKFRSHPAHPGIAPFDINSSFATNISFDHCSSEGVCCCVGGALSFFVIQQPLHLVVPKHNPFKRPIFCSKGDTILVELHNSSSSSETPLGEMESVDSGSAPVSLIEKDESMIDDIVYILNDGTVHGFALRSGVLMFQIDVRWVPVNVSKVGDPHRLLLTNSLEGSHRFKAMKGSLVDLKQGDPCCVHYCSSTGHLAVGYSDGSVRLMTIHLADTDAYRSNSGLEISPSSNIPLKTFETHHTPIAQLAHVSLISKESGASIDYLIVGDEFGLLSVWLLKHKHNLVGTDEVKMTFAGHCHRKAVSHIEVIYLDHSMAHQSVPTRDPVKNQCVVLTACSCGDIKAWSLSTDAGVLTLVGTIKCQNKISAMGVAVLPSIQNSLQGGQGMKKPNQDIEHEEFNIVCAAGHNDGKLSSWIFSSNRKNASMSPSVIAQPHSSKVVSIATIPKTYNGESYLPHDVAKMMLSASLDGSCCLFGIDFSGQLIPFHLYFSPGPVRAVSVCQGDLKKAPKGDVEVVLINESNVTSFIALTAAFNSSAIPVRWRLDSWPKPSDALSVPSSVSRFLQQPTDNSSTGSMSVTSSIQRMASGSSSEVIKSTDHASQQALSLDLYVGPNSGLASPVIHPRGDKSAESPDEESPRSSTSQNDGPKSSGKIKLRDLKRSSSRQLLLEASADGSETPSNGAKQDITPSDNWADTLDIRVELYLAKKDGDLITLFRQNVSKDSAYDDLIKAQDAVDVLDRWISKNIEDDINGQTISRNQILEIFSFLGIDANDFIDFVKVAKIASVLKTLNKAQSSNEPFELPVVPKKNRLTKKYKSMKTHVTRVSYNAMGERVIEKVPLVEKTSSGIPNGYGDEIRQIWNLEAPRVLYHINKRLSRNNEPKTIMKRIPLHIVKRLYGKIKIHTHWRSSLEHWFDLRRTVRVARTIFDMRYVAQQDFLVKSKIKHMKHYDLPSITDLLIKYFERAYGKGHGDMNVAHQKIVMFLEALCQYSEYSLINTLRYFVFCEEEEFEEGVLPTPDHRTIDTYAWLYTEAREWVKSNCKFMNGGEVQNENQSAATSLHAGGLYLENQSVTSLSGSIPNSAGGAMNATHVQWLLIRRNDATHCVEEMLSNRGRYGPAIIENVRYMVDNVLPPISPVDYSESDHDPFFVQPKREFVDFEQFLEVLAFEMKKHDQEIARINDKLFSNKAVTDTQYRTAKPMQDLMHNDKNLPISSYENQCVSQETFHSMQTMTQLFIGLDPGRSGFVTTSIFSNVIMKVLDMSTGSQQDENVTSSFRRQDDKNNLVEDCVVRFGDANGLDSVVYIDFLAILISFLFNTSDSIESFSCDWMQRAVKVTKKSLDRDKALVLLSYLSLAQPHHQYHDVYWMAHCSTKDSADDEIDGIISDIKQGIFSVLKPSTAGDPYGIEEKLTGKISYKGMWNINSTAYASDGPGNMTIQKVLPLYAEGTSEVSLSCDGKTTKSEFQKTSDSNLFIVPTVPSTSRTLQTLHGEVLTSKQNQSARRKEKAVISQFDVSEEAFSSLTANSQRAISTHCAFNNFPPGGSQVIEGIRFDNSHHKLSSGDTHEPKNTQILLTLPTEKNAPLSEEHVQLGPHKASISSDTTANSAETSRIDLPQEYLDLQNRSQLLNEMDDLKASKKERVAEDLRQRIEKVKSTIEGKRRLRGSFRDSSISEGSLDYSLEEGSEEERSSNRSVTGVINLFSKLSEVYPDGFVDECVDDSMKQLQELRDLEEQMAKEKRESALYYQLKMHQKYVQRQLEKKELRRKEKESMRLKEQQDEERFRRLEAGRELSRQRDEQEAEEARARELEEERKKQQRRAEREQANELKRQKEAKEKEKQCELQELLAMRKIDKECAAAEKHLNALAEAERKRKIAEEEAREAKLAEQRRKKLEKEQREAEQARREEERRLREEENERRFAEMVSMQAEDRDAGQDNAEQEVPSEEREQALSRDEHEEKIPNENLSPSDSNNNEDNDDDDDDDYDEIPTKGELNDAKVRLVELIKRLKVARRGNAGHPRRKDTKGAFFQPMSFGNDIQFRPFLTSSSLLDQYGSQEEMNPEDDPESGFDDITRAIKAHKAKLHKDKMQRLYRFNNDNIPLSEWTTLVLRETVDWEEFFDEDYEKSFPGSERAAVTPAEKKKRLARKKEKALQSNSIVVKQEDNVTVVLGDATTVVGDSNSRPLASELGSKVVIPLPLGKVHRNELHAGGFHYFQVELADLSSILTIELNSTSPEDLFEMNMSTTGYFPTRGKADVVASKYHSFNRHVIMYNPAQRASEREFVEMSQQDCRKTHTFIVGVHHKASSSVPSAPYEIWALASSSAQESVHLQNVSKTVKILDIISQSSEESLWKNMPKVHKDAHKSVSENAPKRLIQTAPAKEMESTRDVEEDMENFEKFVTKSGRVKLRQNLSSFSSSLDSAFTDSQYSRLDRPEDPNMHEDLFLRPEVKSLDDVLDRTFSQSIAQLESSSQDRDFPPLLPGSGSPSPSLHIPSDHLMSSTHNGVLERDSPSSSPYQRSESLPVLHGSQLGLATDSFFTNQSSSPGHDERVTTERFPYITKTNIRQGDLNPAPKPRKLRKFPDPKPIKYTTRKA